MDNEQANEQMDIPEFTDDDKRVSNFHNFKSNAEIVGKLLSIEEGSFGKQYKIQTKDEIVTVGTYDVLKSKILDSDVGKFIKIVCKGDAISPKTKRTYKDFDVSIKE